MSKLTIYYHQLNSHLSKSPQWVRMSEEAGFKTDNLIYSAKSKFDIINHLEGRIRNHYKVIDSANINYREIPFHFDIDTAYQYLIHTLHRENAFLSLIYNQKGFFLIENFNEQKAYLIDEICLIYIPLDCFHDLKVSVNDDSIDLAYLNHFWGYKGGNTEVYTHFYNLIYKIKELLYVRLVEKYQ